MVSEKNKGKLGKIHINMPGKHNVQNCLAAIALALDLNIPFATIVQAVKTFKGIERRFSYNGLFRGAEIFDDYGHHPKEILNTLKVARNRAKKKLTVIFQPHRYSRTHKLWDDFVDVFASGGVDNLIITDIYPAREKPIPGVSGLKSIPIIPSTSPVS